jgi:hypothetical protein
MCFFAAVCYSSLDIVLHLKLANVWKLYKCDQVNMSVLGTGGDRGGWVGRKRFLDHINKNATVKADWYEEQNKYMYVRS